VTSAGTEFLDEWVPVDTAPSVLALQAAGAVRVGKSNVDSLGELKPNLVCASIVRLVFAINFAMTEAFIYMHACYAEYFSCTCFCFY